MSRDRPAHPVPQASQVNKAPRVTAARRESPVLAASKGARASRGMTARLPKIKLQVRLQFNVEMMSPSSLWRESLQPVVSLSQAIPAEMGALQLEKRVEPRVRM